MANADSIITYPTFSQSSTGVKFSGGDTATLGVAANNSFNVGDGDFTIDWWQKAPVLQNGFPRLFQFGDGRANSDGFAVSEEGGELHFWLDSRTARSGIPPKVSLSLPDSPNAWKHYAVVRNGWTVTLFLDGFSFNSYTESPPDPNDQLAPQSTLHTPTGIEYLDLLIGGSNDSELGGFSGEITGFEFIKGARWTSNFAPPTTYTNESCLHKDANDICDQERVLLIYPTSDFNATGGALVNRVNGDLIGHAPGVTYGDPLPPTNNLGIQLISSFGGQICAEVNENTETCVVDSTIDVSRDNSTGFTIYIEPNPNFQTDSITITPVGAESITVGIQTDSFTVRDVDNNEFEFLLYDDGELNVPAGMSDFSISANFGPERINVQLTATPYGVSYVNLGLGERAIADTNTVSFSKLKASPITIFAEPNDGYLIEELMVTIPGFAPVTAEANVDSFTVHGYGDEEFTLAWFLPDGELTVPENFPNFSVSFLYSLIPDDTHGIDFESKVNGDSIFFNNPIFIESRDEGTSNDYEGVKSTILEIQYFSNDPLNSDFTSEKNACRNYQDFGITNHGAVLIIEPVNFDDFIRGCSNYHQANELTRAYLFLMDIDEPIEFEEAVIDQTHVLQRILIDFISPPGFTRILSSSEVNFGDTVTAQVSNIDRAVSIAAEIFSTVEYSYGYCWMQMPIRENDVILPEFLDSNGNFIFPVPTLQEVNDNCGNDLNNGATSINQNISHQINFHILDGEIGGVGEETGYLTLKAVTQTSPEEVHSEPDTHYEYREVIPNQTIEVKKEEPSEPKPVEVPQVKPETKLDTSWCTKKGIWIFTVSGKLRMCDPVKKVALEMIACAGRDESPTFPWIFRAQRFYPGEIPTKSGTKLYNSVFFFKGLAISGSDKVSSTPCSSGSVFIPMKYSKTVLEFAKREKPLIWVKAA